MLFLGLNSFSCSQPSVDLIQGRWEGFAILGEQRMEVAIDFTTSPEGLLARITALRERVLNKRLANFQFDPPHVDFDVPFGERQAPFRGTVHGDSLTGTVSMGEASMRMFLYRRGTTQPPPYDEEEIQFTNGALQLSGSLLLPQTPAPHAAVVLIHGSSTPSRDDFRFYGDLFARRGIAAFMYDKRSTGGQLGGMSQVDLRDLAGDVIAAVSHLKRRVDIDPNRIGLWGHSQGGWVAPIAAAQYDSVAFIVGFSAPGVTYGELDKYANASRLRRTGFSQDDIVQAMASLRRVDDFVRNGGDATEMQNSLDSAHLNRWASYTTLPRLAPTPEDIRSWLRWRNLDLDPIGYWRTISCPVLLLYGENDEVVPVDVSSMRIRDALMKGGNSRVMIKMFSGENHNIAGSEEFLDLMVNWVLEQTSTRR